MGFPQLFVDGVCCGDNDDQQFQLHTSDQGVSEHSFQATNCCFQEVSCELLVLVLMEITDDSPYRNFASESPFYDAASWRSLHRHLVLADCGVLEGGCVCDDPLGAAPEMFQYLPLVCSSSQAMRATGLCCPFSLSSREPCMFLQHFPLYHLIADSVDWRFDG